MTLTVNDSRPNNNQGGLKSNVIKIFNI